MAATIIIKRNKSFMGLAPLTIFINDNQVGSVGNGKSVSFSVEEGQHLVYVAELQFNLIRSREIRINIKDGDIINFSCSLKSPILPLDVDKDSLNKIVPIAPISSANQAKKAVGEGLSDIVVPVKDKFTQQKDKVIERRRIEDSQLMSCMILLFVIILCCIVASGVRR